jgi:uncharacterized membrane protein YebE (DUF533 family)
MNKTNKATAGAIAILMVAGLAATADVQARERGINERQHHQRDRVAAGVRGGEIDRHELRRLRRDAGRIDHKERAFRADGHFSRAERREIHHDLDRHGRLIREARSDHGRPGWHGGPDWGRERGRHDGHRGGIDGLQHRQQSQIREGMRNGSLTPQEARRLYGEQREIAALERSYRADGVLTRSERHDLREELRDAGRHIYNQSHDDDRRDRR